MMQDFEWKDNVAKLIPYKPANLFLIIDGNLQTILYLPSQQSRTLVGVSINPSNNNSTIFSIYQTKLDQYIASLQIEDLSLSKI